jgi:hypothetical protein
MQFRILKSKFRNQNGWIDGSLYPDQDVPDRLDILPDRIDFIARLCSAWDFGLLPLPITLKEILKKDWRQAVDETQLLTSCAYHLLRERHDLESLPYLGPKFPHILEDPFLTEV